MTKKRICIISFSDVRSDGRVLRQIKYLAPHYELYVIGYGHRPSVEHAVKWYPIEHSHRRFDKGLMLILLVAARLIPSLYNLAYWSRRHYCDAVNLAAAAAADLYYANEWAAVPIAVEAAQKNGARVIYDAHEYSPLEREEDKFWMSFFSPLIVYILRRFSQHIDASITVALPIAETYSRNFDLNPFVVLNTPDLPLVDLPSRNFTGVLQIVHHGSAQRSRHIQSMIEAVGQCQRDVLLELFLVATEPDYIDELHSLSERIAQGQVHFHDPVSPPDLVRTIAGFHLGLCLIPPLNYNYRMALPNKLFECIVAGVPVVVGPSPAMAGLVEQYQCGIVLPSFEIADLAKAIHDVTPEQLSLFAKNAQQAAKELNATFEMRKVVSLCDQLISSSGRARD